MRRKLLATAILLSLISSASAADVDLISDIYKNRNFDIALPGDIHISAFVFRDQEGDGQYHEGDRPMADVYVGLTGSAGETIYERSNIDGFANFKASTTVEDVDVTLPGKYRFEVLPPPGWRVTTGNAVQEIELADLAGSPGGLVAKSLPSLVGLKNDTQPVVGSGHLPLSKGDQVTHIGFDDVIQSIAVKKLHNGYHGLQWDNWVVAHQRFYKGEGYINGTADGEFVAYNGSGHPMTVSRDKPFDFIGGQFTAAWQDAEGETALVTAWRGDQVVYKDEIKLSRFGPVNFQANYDRVTKVEFRTKHYWQVVADDLRFILN